MKGRNLYLANFVREFPDNVRSRVVTAVNIHNQGVKTNSKSCRNYKATLKILEKP